MVDTCEECQRRELELARIGAFLEIFMNSMPEDTPLREQIVRVLERVPSEMWEGRRP